MFIYLDTENTGSGPDDRLCQIAFKTDTGTIRDELFNPGRSISVEAMSIHHIVPISAGEDTAAAIRGAKFIVVKCMGHVMPNLDAYLNDI